MTELLLASGKGARPRKDRLTPKSIVRCHFPSAKRLEDLGNRDAARRFIQAAGVVTRVCRGETRTGELSSQASLFDKVDASQLERRERSAEHKFRFGFIRAICLWLEGGRERLAQHFTRSNSLLAGTLQALTQDEINTEVPRICARLMAQSSTVVDRKIVNVSVTRFATDEQRIIFQF